MPQSLPACLETMLLPLPLLDEVAPALGEELPLLARDGGFVKRDTILPLMICVAFGMKAAASWLHCRLGILMKLVSNRSKSSIIMSLAIILKCGAPMRQN